MSGNRAGRLWPAVLVSLALLLGLGALSPGGDHAPAPVAAVTAGVHADRPVPPPGPRLQPGEDAFGKPLLAAAVPPAAADAALAYGRRTRLPGAGATPAIRARFTRASRAPPRRLLFLAPADVSAA